MLKSSITSVHLSTISVFLLLLLFFFWGGAGGGGRGLLAPYIEILFLGILHMYSLTTEQDRYEFPDYDLYYGHFCHSFLSFFAQVHIHLDCKLPEKNYKRRAKPTTIS